MSAHATKEPYVGIFENKMVTIVIECLQLLVEI